MKAHRQVLTAVDIGKVRVDILRRVDARDGLNMTQALS